TPNASFEKIDPSDRVVSGCQQLGKGKATPENRVLLRFHTGSAETGSLPSERGGAQHLTRHLFVTVTLGYIFLGKAPDTARKKPAERPLLGRVAGGFQVN
ncbi:hypothetical protein, partial [Paraburkholderia sp.]|uniref:hypothetical protein n=1 Tax=Paraburkholderia sp. TaxID=1926495 RepID=UPI003C7B7359